MNRNLFVDNIWQGNQFQTPNTQLTHKYTLNKDNTWIYDIVSAGGMGKLKENIINYINSSVTVCLHTQSLTAPCCTTDTHTQTQMGI